MYTRAYTLKRKFVECLIISIKEKKNVDRWNSKPKKQLKTKHESWIKREKNGKKKLKKT